MVDFPIARTADLMLALEHERGLNASTLEYIRGFFERRPEREQKLLDSLVARVALYRRETDVRTASLIAALDEETALNAGLREALRKLSESSARIANIPVGGGCPCRGLGSVIVGRAEWPCPNECPSATIGLWVNNRRKAINGA